MKSHLFTLLLFCFCITCFSQDKSLFPKEDSFDYSIKTNDASLLYKQLLKNSIASNSYVLPDYKAIEKKRTFIESENSAIKNVMPVYIPEGNFKQKTIFPDTTMSHSLIITPVKER